jgi:peptidoglycan hydrolase CwlO-like protein
MYSKIKAQTAENESIKKSLKEMEAKFATLQNSYDSIKKSLEPKKEEKIEKAAQPSDEVLNILKSLKSENEELRKSQNEIVKALDRTARPRQSMSSVQPLNKSEASADPSDVRQIPYGQMMPIMEELYKSKKVTMDELIFFNTNKTLAIESVVPVQEYFSKKK